MSDEWRRSASLGAIVGCVLALVLIAISWAPHTSRPAPKWEPGSFVHSVLTGQAGQVIEARCRRGEKVCYYDVRFRDLVVTPLMREWELDAHHLHLMADQLASGKPYPMLAEEPQHCAMTMLADRDGMAGAAAELRREPSIRMVFGTGRRVCGLDAQRSASAAAVGGRLHAGVRLLGGETR